MKRVLYISYDGLLDPLGYSQVQPYLRELGRAGVELWVLSFEKPGRLGQGREVEQVRLTLASAGVRWRRLCYHKRPAALATAWDVFRGVLAVMLLVTGKRIGIIHVRSYVAALIGLVPAALPGRRFLFDMRGFWADERVEGGLWPAGGLLYRAFKRLERRYLARADAVVVLSERGADVLGKWLSGRKLPPQVRVVPTCVDLELFRPAEDPVKPPGGNGLRLIYLGSLGTWYLMQEMLAFFAVLRDRVPGSSFSILTPSDPAALRSIIAGDGIPPGAAGRVAVGAVAYGQVPAALQQADCSIFFIRPSFSKQASCATKFAESLACGLPVIINAGVGDQDRRVREAGVGVVLERLDRQHYEKGVDELLELLKDSSLAARCRQAAVRGFSLEGAVRSYLELYRDLSAHRPE
ncbi:MAG: glycosyltransferase [Candidatus Glassbacteria bacterium]|nr:glycosyltransferase [Candidatus Glassbacteria bacterium]